MARLMTYNVHRCVGMDRRLDLDRVAALIAEHEPDIVCLQEVDVGRQRTAGLDQAHELAKRLEMAFRFHPALRVEEEQYGDAVMTHLPERLVRAGPLPTLAGVPGLEPRGALHLEITIGGESLHVINTHLGLLPREQRLQALALLGRDWLGAAPPGAAVVLAGDFNATPLSRPWRRLASGPLRDGQRDLGPARTRPTFPSAFPVLRIDHVFVSDAVRVTAAEAPWSPLARMASDHLPLVVDFEIRPWGRR